MRGAKRNGKKKILGASGNDKCEGHGDHLKAAERERRAKGRLYGQLDAWARLVRRVYPGWEPFLRPFWGGGEVQAAGRGGVWGGG